MKNSFYFMLKALFVLKIPKSLPWYFGYVKKWLDNKAKVNFEIYDVADWQTNNYTTHIAQYLKKWRQSGNEIWLDNRIKHEYHFSLKFMQKMRKGDWLQTSSCFFKKLYIMSK